MKIKSNTNLSLRKVLLSALVAAPLATLPAPLWAIPQVIGYTGNTTAPNVTSNSTATSFTYIPTPATPAPFPITSTTLQITDTITNRLVLKWNEFGAGFSPINAGDSIIWTLPSSTSAVLNLVTGGSPTLISGGAPGASLTSNGSIFVVNPNGITLGAGATVNASGFGMSTVTQNEFYFLANGTLDPSTTALAAATTNIVSAGTINVGSTGNVIMSARSVDVSGSINGGTLTVNTTTGGTGARLAQTAALNLGTTGVAATGTTAEVPGAGDLIINSNGAPVVLSGGAGFTTTVHGGDVTIDSAGGAISQGAAAVIIGDGLSDPKLTITAGTGTITLATLDVTGSNANRLDVRINSAGNTEVRVADDVRLVSSTITGTLSLRSNNRSITASGSSSVSGAVTLQAANERDITFNSVGDVTFAGITSGTHADSDVTLVSGGSIVLPGINVGGNITVTAATNITQAAGTLIKNDYSTSKRAKFEATTGSITLANTTNDFGNVQLNAAPGGVTLTDADDVTIFKDTNVTGNVSITAGSVIFGRDSDDVITFNGTLTVSTTGGTGVADVVVTAGGAYTAAPTVSFAGGGTGTSTLSVTGVTVATGGAGFTTAPTVTIAEGTSTAAGTSTIDLNAVASFTGGTAYTSAPTVAITGGGGTVTTTPTATLGVTTLTLGGTQAGYAVGDTINVAGGGSTAPAVITVTAVTGGAITGFTVTQGAGFTTLAPAGLTATTATGTGTGATVATAAGVVNAVTAPAGTGFTAQPTVAFTGGGATTQATAVVAGTLGTVTITSGGSGFVLGGAGLGAAETITVSTAGQTAAPTFNAPVGTVTDVVVTTSGAGFTAAPAVTFTAGTTTATGAAVLGAGAGGGISDATNNLTVIGASQFTSLGPVTLDGATSSGIGLNNRFGVINVNQGASVAGVTLYESTTLNLGAITTAGKLRAYSSAGEVIDTGPLLVGSGLAASAIGAEFGAGTAAAPGNITIDSAGTTINGLIAILDDVALVTNSPANGGPGGVIGTYLANNVNITTAGTINLARVLNTAGTGIAGNLALTATAAGSDIMLADGVGVAGTVTLTAADAVTASDSENVISNVTVVAGGDVSVRSDSNLTVNATLTQNAPGKVAKFEANGLQIGAFNSDYTGAQVGQNSSPSSVWFRSNGSNDIVDNVNGMRVFGSVQFDSNRHITINNAGHSFGMVSAATRGNNGNITITESGGLRLGTVTTNGRGSFTATSTTGDILQTVDQNGIRLGNGETGTATFNAPMGAVTLNDNDQTGTTDVDEDNTNNMAIINVSAGGNVVINNPRVDGGGVVIGPVTLGNVTAGGSLSVDSANRHTAGVAVAATASNIVQNSGTRVNSFGLTTFTASGASAITIGNTGNRMGGVIATTGSGAITLTESPTLNLIAIQTTGALAARSETDSIVDTAFTIPAAPAGNTTAAPVNSLGTAASPLSGTFTASSAEGHVILDLPTSNFGAVGFSTGGNVVIFDNVGNTTLTASTIGGTLDVFNLTAGGIISQSGALAVTGNVTLTANSATGGIDLSNTANMFGGIRFTAGAPGVLIAENTTLNLRAGSTSIGPVQLVTNGDFITSGAGASSITNNLTIQAQGTIIPGAGSLLVTGVFTVFSPSLKDLSALSKSGNLLNRDPVNLGSGPYVPPSL